VKRDLFSAMTIISGNFKDNDIMKRGKQTKTNNATKYVRIDPYTWIEKRVDEPDEVTRQKFLMKISEVLERPEIRLRFLRTSEI